MSFTKKLKAGLVRVPPTEFIGQHGTLFYDDDSGVFRISDGVTVGGLPISIVAGGVIGNLQVNDTTFSTIIPNANLTLATNGTGIIDINGRLHIHTVPYTPGDFAVFEVAHSGQITSIVSDVDAVSGAVSIIGNPPGTKAAVQLSGAMLHITGQQSLPSRIYNDGIGTYSAYIGKRMNGTSALPTGVLANQVISRIGCNSFLDTGTWSEISTGRIDFVAMENQSSANVGCQIEFWTTGVTGNTIQRSLIISGNSLTFPDGTTTNTAGIPLSQKAAQNGVASLGADGKLASSQIPASLSGAILHKGIWNAITNTPTISDATGMTGWSWSVNVGGIRDLGSGPITFISGDTVLHNGMVYQLLTGAAAVRSINTRFGDVTITNADVIDALNSASILNSKLQNSTINIIAGTGMSTGGVISLGGSATLNNAGVLAVSGTASQINTTSATGEITLSLPTEGVTMPGPLTLRTGTATISPLAFTSGALLTAPSVGQMEFSNNIWYGTPNSTERGVFPTEQFYVLAAARSYIPGSAGQTSLLGVGVTLSSNTRYYVNIKTSGSRSSAGGATMSLGFLGTAVLSRVSVNAIGSTSTGPFVIDQYITTGFASGVVITSSGVSSSPYIVDIFGIIDVTTGGTVIPSIGWSTDPGTVTVPAHSYVRIFPIGNISGNTSVGSWA